MVEGFIFALQIVLILDSREYLGEIVIMFIPVRIRAVLVLQDVLFVMHI